MSRGFAEFLVQKGREGVNVDLLVTLERQLTVVLDPTAVA